MGKKNSKKKSVTNRFVSGNDLKNLGINTSKIQKGVNSTQRKVQNKGFSGKKKK